MPVLVVGVIVIYFINRKRADRYITYADYNEYRTSGGKVFLISDLQRIRYIDKYVIGRGTETANYGIAFYFSNGMVEIERNSNIYKPVFDHAEKLDVAKSHTITKGLLRAEP